MKHQNDKQINTMKPKPLYSMQEATIYLLLFCMIIFSGCSKSLEELEGHSEFFKLVEETKCASTYDSHMQSLTKALSSAIINNQSLKTLIHEEVLKQLDGDYDVLMKDVTKKAVRCEDALLTKGSDNMITVGDLINLYLPVETKSISSESVLDQLKRENPNLQIAVPIHAEEWDPTTYTPVVAFLPEDYNDDVEVIYGYNSKGEYVAIDAINEPDVPVIIISQNERQNNIDEYLIPNYPIRSLDSSPTVSMPSAPSNLSVNLSPRSTIVLSWNCADSVSYYRVWRKGPGESTFENIGNSDGPYNRTYEDSNISGHSLYYYYVTAVNASLYDSKESQPSSIVSFTTPSGPSGISNFKSLLTGSDVELRWNNNGDTNSDVVVEYSMPNNGQSNYSILQRFSGSTDNYIYTPSVRGNIVRYKVYRENALGRSDSQYDYIYPSYRASNRGNPVCVTQISFTDWALERWPAGKPEFYVKGVGKNDSNQTVEIVDQARFDFSSKTTSQSFSDRQLINWEYSSDGDWYSTLTFYMEEYDSNFSKLKFEASAKYNKKLSNDLELNVAASLSVDFSDKGEYCGTDFTHFYESKTKLLVFQNYGARLRLGSQ